jgi:hypothetical protein
MKRRIILICLVGMFILSCSKSDDDLASKEPQVIEKTFNPIGTFEGKWKLSKYGLRYDGTIEVSDSAITFDLPADYLLPRLTLKDSIIKADATTDEPIAKTEEEYTYYNTMQTLKFVQQGYSSDILYTTINSTSNAYTTLDCLIEVGGQTFALPKPEEKTISFRVKAGDVDYRIDLLGIKEAPSAVFDATTGLWTIALPIDKATVYNLTTGRQIIVKYIDEEVPDRSAWLFVFRATSKI